MKYILFTLFSSLGIMLYGQSEKRDLLLIFENQEINNIERFDACFKLVQDHYLKNRIDSAYIYSNKLLDFTIKENLIEKKAEALNLKGFVEYNLSNYKEAFTFYDEAYTIYKTKNDTIGKINSLVNIGLLLNSEFKFKSSISYLKKSLELALALEDVDSQIYTLANLGFVYNNSFKIDSSKIYLEKALKLATDSNHPKEFILKELGNNYVKNKDYKTALVYFKNAIIEARKNSNLNVECATNFAISSQYIFQDLFLESIPYSKKSLSIAKEISDKVFTKGALLNLYEAYREMGDNDNAIIYLEQTTSEESIIQDVQFNRALQDFEIKQIRLKDSLVAVNQMLKKDIQFQNEKSNQRLLWLSILFVITIIGILIYKKLKQKQIEAEQESIKQIEENQKIIKNIELSTLDAMIAGQEKERQIVAAELHDNIASLITSIKIHFEYFMNYNNQKSEEITFKLSSLLDNLYNEIRSLSHYKNASIMKKDSLVPALEKLVHNLNLVQGLNLNLKINEIPSGIDNTTELGLFRIIQEIVNNIIKHAEASQVDIHLTTDEQNLNILVEDNGIGFNPNQTLKNNTGIGLHTIENRIENLGGKLIIESQPQQGTSVIIDVPV